ncbi:metallophosphoesterase family protein [Luteolibacter marinus]|uniref:metallophosphoesterase family protein n=1 Tax=Luteolibacter marinus TaxID=2776705 RepID=UPI00186831ED|nr:DNA repair exonuclease [Luteolibacter marinus]
MLLTVLHTADWQIGKPFASVSDPDKRLRLQQERLRAIERIAALSKSESADLVLVAGDLFDSPSPTKATVSATFHAIGKIGVPVIAIPGNHDFGGPGGPWEQDFVRQEAAQLAPNFSILTTAEPLVLDNVVILPAPLQHRQNLADPTAWIRTAFGEGAVPDDRPRIVLAHGSVQGFSSAGDEEEAGDSNVLDLPRLPAGEIDYIALGDWHGTKQVGEKAWYAGTPEIDRFPKGEDNQPGHVLVAMIERGAPPEVRTLATSTLRWHQLGIRFDGEAGVSDLDQRFAERVGTGAEGCLLLLELDGSLTIEESIRLRELLDTWDARLVRLKLRDRVVEAPSDEELAQLTDRRSDPLISRVASRLAEQAARDGDEAAIARHALRELYQLTLRHQKPCA